MGYYKHNSKSKTKFVNGPGNWTHLKARILLGGLYILHAIRSLLLLFPVVFSLKSLIDLFTDTAAILNSIVLTEKLWAAEGAIAGKFIVYTAFRINFYCLSLIFHNKYYKRHIFPSRYLAVVPMVIEKLLLKVITPQYSF